jgi:hypothetical protein
MPPKFDSEHPHISFLAPHPTKNDVPVVSWPEDALPQERPPTDANPGRANGNRPRAAPSSIQAPPDTPTSPKTPDAAPKTPEAPNLPGGSPGCAANASENTSPEAKPQKQRRKRRGKNFFRIGDDSDYVPEEYVQDEDVSEEEW